MTVTFRKPTSQIARARLCLAGLSGAGKTMTALQAARALAGPDGSVFVLDTENAASVYVAHADFQLATISDMSPATFIEGIRAAERGGADVLIIDNLSDEYTVSVLGTVQSHKNTQQGWGSVTPAHSALISVISNAALHVICTAHVRLDEKRNAHWVQREDMLRPFHVAFTVSPAGLVVSFKSRLASLPIGTKLPRDGAALVAALDVAALRWNDNPERVAKFLAWAERQGLMQEDIAAALGVEDVAAYQGSDAAAQQAVQDYAAEMRNTPPATPQTQPALLPDDAPPAQSTDAAAIAA